MVFTKAQIPFAMIRRTHRSEREKPMLTPANSASGFASILAAGDVEGSRLPGEKLQL